MLRFMVLEFKESGRIFFSWMIRVSKHIHEISVCLHKILNLFISVFTTICVSFACSWLQSISIASFFAHSHNLLDSSFAVSSSKVVSVKQEFHNSGQLRLFVFYKILVSAKVDWVLTFFSAMSN
jgi:hypothetical protein